MDDGESTAHPFPTHASEDEEPASWHPALRQNARPAEEDDDFFERYPKPTPKKRGEAVEEDELSEPQSPIRRQSISVQSSVNVHSSDATAEELRRVPSNHVQVEGPLTAHSSEEESEEDEEEDPILEPGESATDQQKALEDHMPSGEEDEDEEAGYGRMETEEATWSPSEHYEHQGEATEMDEAQDPSAQASLLKNEEPLPTTSSRQSTLGFDGAPASRQYNSRAPRPLSQVERSFTSNFSDSPVTTRPSAKSISEGWPSFGDDKTFGELLDKHQPSQIEQEGLRRAAARESAQIASPDMDLLPEEEGEVPEEDLAAAWGAALDDDDILEETPTDLDPSSFFDEDDDGFLEDEPPAPAPASVQPVQQQRNQYAPANLQSTPQQSQYGGLASPQFFDQGAHGRSAGTPSTGLYDLYQSHAPQQQSQPQRPGPGVTQQAPAQSFSDKSKGGYQSPYDLPMDVVKPRRRPQIPQQQPTPAQTPVAPPARSSSMSSQQPPQGFPPKPPSVASLSPPNSRGSAASSGAPPALGTLAKSTSKTGSGFFEELPITTKARPRATGAFTPQQPSTPTFPPPGQVMSPPRSTHGPPQPSPPVSQQGRAPAYGGLQQLERMALLPEQGEPQFQHPPAQQGPPPSTRYSPRSQQPSTGNMGPPPPPAAPNRYSPAPTATAPAQAPPVPTSRYSPAPQLQPTQAKPRNSSLPNNVAGGIHPFAPRTSSPLAAHTDKPHPPLPGEARGLPPSSPPRVNGLQRQSVSPPESGLASKYSPMETRPVEHQHPFGPPLPLLPPNQRPQTQSPETAMKIARQARPTSAGMAAAAPQPAIQPRRPVLPHRRQFSRELTFAVPQDERSMDPLKRWRGHPIFKWNASGTLVSSFPKQTPFYAAGQGIPSVKCTPGSVTVQDASTFMPMDERNAKFPGPLTARSKGKKKEVLAWLASKIEVLERAAESAKMDFPLPTDLKNRAEEKVILWKLMRIFLEHDGVLEGNAKIEEEVRAVLLPNLAQMAQVAELQSPVSASLSREAIDMQVVLQMRQALLEGQRERAVWLAEENKLWGHAMLIASTMGPEIWKQIIQAFVRSQVKSFGSDARSMAALYQVFAGNSEECVDELVPPSARAGFQMISKTDGSVSGNPLEGLDQWRETLGLVTSNRTASDGASLLALGKLLAHYGRVEAAHSCYLFARTQVKHSGADDTEAHFVLLGGNHQSTEESLGSDLDTILLTEVYEYAVSLSAPSTAVPYIPHLQAYKLVHAQELAAYGLKAKSQSYCDAITSAYQSTTRPSPYYHPTFSQSVADMSAFLSRTPHDGKSGSFLSKPALKSISSGTTSWFNRFVAGDDDQESTGSGPGGPGSEGMDGPFGGVSGDSGSISRSGSVTDLYGGHMGAIPIHPGAVPTQNTFGPSSAPSRYNPSLQAGGSKYSPFGGSGIPGAEPQRPSSSRYAPPPSAHSNLGIPKPNLARRASDQSIGSYAPLSRRGSAQDTTSSQGSYEPRPILADEGSNYSYSPPVLAHPMHSPPVHSPLVLAQYPPDVAEPEPLDAPNGMRERAISEADSFDPENAGGYIPPSSGYEPPSYSYQPYEPDPESPVKDAKPRKRFGDDDDDDANDLASGASAAAQKAKADREADEAFRKAAEADAARDKANAGGEKKGWMSGWFGKKDPNAAPGPIKAKLGEENSFYWDENLRKWVNKKAGPDTAAAAAPTPPPPKGPPSRVASGSMGPPSGPPSRNSSGTGLSNMVRPPTSGSGPAFTASGPPSRVGTPASEAGGALPSTNGNGDVVPLAPPLLPPSAMGQRPSSSLSNASSIDDLLAGAPPRKAGGASVKGKKKGRYVDVMAK